MKPVILLSRRKEPGEPRETICVLIGEKRYTYTAPTYQVDKFTYMLRKGAGFNAINYFKKVATLEK